MPVSRLCRARIHDWGEGRGVPGAKCIRCGKEYGKQAASKGQEATPVPPAAPPAAAAKAARPLASSDSLRRAAARISGKPTEGSAAATTALDRTSAPAEVVEDTDGPATRAKEDEETTLLADLVRPLGPNVLVNGSAAIINHGLWLFKPRKALEPDPDFFATFTKQWQRSVTRLVPKLELHPVTATLLSATAVLGSMWWMAPLMEPPAPELPPLPPPKGEERCPPKDHQSPAAPNAAGSADTPLFAPNSSNGLTPLSPILSNPSETSAIIGDAESVELDA